MGMTLTWDTTDPNLLYWHCDGEWSWHDYFATLESLKEELVFRGNDRVDIVCELSESTMIAPGIVTNLQKNNPTMTADGGWWGITVIVGGGQFAKSSLGILKLVNRYLGQRYYDASTVDEALGIIAQYRVTKMVH